MQKTLKSTLARQSLAILAILAISSCKKREGNGSGGTHNMGGPKASYPMSDAGMTRSR